MSLIDHEFQDVVRGDDTNQVSAVVHHGQGDQVVLLEEINHGTGGGVRGNRNQRVRRKLFERRCGLRKEDASDWNRAGQDGIAVH